MSVQYRLLLIIAISFPVTAAEQGTYDPSTPRSVIHAVPDKEARRTDTANETGLPVRPARKSRVRQTFPPSTKRM